MPFERRKSFGGRRGSFGGRDSFGGERRGGWGGGFGGESRGGWERREEPKPVKEGEEHDVTISEVSRKGDGIARIENFVVFVPNTKAGDKVHIRIKEVRGRHAVGEVISEGAEAPLDNHEAGGEEVVGEEESSEETSEQPEEPEEPGEGETPEIGEGEEGAA